MENEKVSDCSPIIQDATGRSKDPNLCLPIPKPSDFLFLSYFDFPPGEATTENIISEKQKKDLLTENIPLPAKWCLKSP